MRSSSQAPNLQPKGQGWVLQNDWSTNVVGPLCICNDLEHCQKTLAQCDRTEPADFSPLCLLKFVQCLSFRASRQLLTIFPKYSWLSNDMNGSWSTIGFVPQSNGVDGNSDPSLSLTRHSYRLRKSLPFHTGEFPITWSAGNFLEYCTHLTSKNHMLALQILSTATFALTLYTHHSSTLNAIQRTISTRKPNHLASASASRPGNHKEKHADPSKCPGKR